MVYIATDINWDTLTVITSKRFVHVACKDNDHVIYVNTRLTLKSVLNYSKDRRSIINWTYHIPVGLKEILILNKGKIVLFLSAWLSVYRLSIVGIATRSHERNTPGIESRWGRGFSHPSIQTLWPTQPLMVGYRISLPGIMWPGRSVDHPPPSRAEIKKRIELYFYAPSGPSWSVVGWTSHLMYDYCLSCLPNCGSYSRHIPSPPPPPLYRVEYRVVAKRWIEESVEDSFRGRNWEKSLNVSNGKLRTRRQV